jgi:predicted Zn finger-like uncharacterized protein
MLIQCTSCGAQAKIPDSKEGAKVRCPSCEHVYVARRPGATAASKSDPTKYFVLGGALIVGAILVTIFSGGSDKQPPVLEPTPKLPPKVVVDELGWDSPAVRLVRDLHVAAVVQNRAKLLEAIDGAAAYADWRERELAANAAAIAEVTEANAKVGEGVEPEPVPEPSVIPSWQELSLPDQNIFVAGLIDGIVLKDDENHLSAWQPFSGSVIELLDDSAIVRVQVSRLQGDQGETRTVEWRLVDRRSPGAPEASWRAAGWNRYFTPEELASARRKKHKKTIKRTLSDGSFVVEGEIRQIPYEPDVPQAERDRIDALIKQRMDLDARPRVRTEAGAALVAAGKPAIAPLLSAIANAMPVIEAAIAAGDDVARENEMIRLGQVHLTLTEMTGYNTTFKIDERLGTTKERIESGLKQWFGWYDSKYKKFTGLPAPTDDPLFDDPDWQPRTEKERIEFERARRERDGG